MGSDSAIVRVAKVFDTHRNQLQAQLEEEQTRLSHQALHDALTGPATTGPVLGAV